MTYKASDDDTCRMWRDTRFLRAKFFLVRATLAQSVFSTVQEDYVPQLSGTLRAARPRYLCSCSVLHTLHSVIILQQLALVVWDF